MLRNAAVVTLFCALSVVLPPALAAQPVQGDSTGYNNNSMSLYYYSFANRQLNSLINTSTSASGKKAFTIKLLKDKHKNYSISRELFFLDDSSLVMDCRYTLVCIDLKVMNLDGKLEWENKVSVEKPNQPPLVSKKSKV